jgi:hypothetical protein
MSNVIVDMGMSLDIFIAGPRNALGDGGMRIHRWVIQSPRVTHITFRVVKED